MQSRIHLTLDGFSSSWLLSLACKPLDRMIRPESVTVTWVGMPADTSANALMPLFLMFSRTCMPSLMFSNLSWICLSCAYLIITRLSLGGFLYEQPSLSNATLFPLSAKPPRTHKRGSIFVNMFKLSSRRPRDRSQNVSTLNAAIHIADAVKDTTEILSVKEVFASASTVLTLIRVSQDLYRLILGTAAKRWVG